MPGADLVTVEDVSKTYARNSPPAVSHLGFTLRRREILAILGPSGSGKTTILRLIAGFDRPDAGRILLDGRPVSGEGAWVEPEDRRMGMVFQDYALFPHLTLLDNVAFGLRNESRKSRSDTARSVLDVVGMADLARRYPHEISGGQQQRVALARALAPDPLVLLLDEPFSNLDSDMRAEMREELLRILQGSETSAVVVTHDQEEAFALADRIGVLNRGGLEQISRPEVLYGEPRTRFVADFVGQSDFVPGVVRGVIETELGSFPNASGLPDGSRVELLARPDEVEVEASEDGNGVVARRRFRGSETLYHLTLPSGAQLRSSQPSACALSAGARVKVVFRPANVVVFPCAEPPDRAACRKAPSGGREPLRGASAAEGRSAPDPPPNEGAPRWSPRGSGPRWG